MPNRPRKVGDLARATGDLLVAIDGDADVLAGGLSSSSDAVAHGDLFVCVIGYRRDGHDHAAAALDAGAVALVTERPLGLGVPEVIVTDSRRALGRIAAEIHGRPGEKLTLLGITGTNGKTTTAYLLESICRAAGREPGLIGTIETRFSELRRPGVRTTPDSPELQLLLSEMVAAGADSVVMEVTSHALVLHRVETLRFSSAAFTNLSQDHLDFHRDMEDYFAAKRLLFTRERASKGAVNVDDPYGRKLFEESPVECLSFGSSPDAQVRAGDVRFGAWGNEFVIELAQTPDELKVTTRLVGAFNVSNCLAACATALNAGIGLDAIGSGIEQLDAVPGRFEPVDAGQPFSVVVDYAHTPDSLDNVLREARRLAAHSGGRVVCAFGCGGDRDRAKRPLMGAVAAGLADVVVVTSDNPRTEEPNAIIAEIVEGVMSERPSGPDEVIPDRADAIAHACSVAQAGDVVIIAGKGHETGQEFADATVPFDDRVVARAALEELGW